LGIEKFKLRHFGVKAQNHPSSKTAKILKSFVKITEIVSFQETGKREETRGKNSRIPQTIFPTINRIGRSL
jgi:hypothetical protein